MWYIIHVKKVYRYPNKSLNIFTRNEKICQEEKEVKKKSEKGVLDESTAKNRLIGSEEEINDEPEFDENAVGIQDNVFVKDPSQLQKVNWWRRMKMIFIVIWIILLKNCLIFLKMY